MPLWPLTVSSNRLSNLILKHFAINDICLKTVEIVLANPLIQRSSIKEGDNCHSCVKDEFVATVQNQISCLPG